MNDDQVLWSKVFGAAHKPHRRIGRGKHQTIHGSFPTEKCAAGFIRTRLPLMMHGLIHLDTDPDVGGLAAYPFKELYWFEHHRSGRRLKATHIPDLAVRTRNQNVVLIDYVPAAIQDEIDGFRQRMEFVRAHYEDRYGCAYFVHDERALHRQPLFSNLKLMWSHKRLRFEPHDLQSLRSALRTKEPPITIAQVFADLHHLRGGDPESLRTATFTAAMQLCMSGEIDVDLSQPLTFETMITDIYGPRKPS